MEYEIIAGKRVNSTLLYIINEKQLYTKKSSYEHKSYYACYINGCKCRVLVRNGVCEKTTNEKHEHEDQEEVYDELKALNNIKRKCLEMQNIEGTSALGCIKRAFKEECISNQQGTKNLDFLKIQRGLQYLTSKVAEKAPKSIADASELFTNENTMKSIGMSLHENDDRRKFFKFCYEDPEFGYCIFESIKTIELIKTNIPHNNARKIIVDTSFYNLPFGEIKHLMVIHIEHKEELFPFLFVLLTSRSQKCYTHIFNYVRTNILNLDGATFITEYETSLRLSIRAEFPNSKAMGSWFYFCQAVGQHMTKITRDLCSYIKQNDRAKLQYHKLQLLPLMPPEEIYKAFEEIKCDIGKFDEQLKFATFLNYYEKIWLKQIGVQELSLFGTIIRTNFALESYNEVLSKKCVKLRSFLKFVKFIQNEEFNKSNEFSFILNNSDTYEEYKRKKPKNSVLCKIEKSFEKLRAKTITTRICLNWLALPKIGVFTEFDLNIEEFNLVEKIKEEVQDEEMFLQEVEDEKMFQEVEDDKKLLQSMLQLPQTDMCVICRTVKANNKMTPCGHINTCNGCVLKLIAAAIDNGLENYCCPECYDIVEDAIEVVR